MGERKTPRNAGALIFALYNIFGKGATVRFRWRINEFESTLGNTFFEWQILEVTYVCVTYVNR